MVNRLAEESSPYLQQHADNPVWWFPWGEQAFTEARRQDKPILLSVGYAACHWCHVMAHESFEDPTTAAMMNESFINVKVDREERPDVDSIYMKAVVAMSGQGGWPMTVMLTPEGEPFFGGTYYPPTPRYGMPSFKQVLESVALAWKDKREEIVQSANQITAQLDQAAMATVGDGAIDHALLAEAVRNMRGQFDAEWGGFGGAPKFPQPMTIEFLLRYYTRTSDQSALFMAERTLERMASGGMYDQVGGGFARYSTDREWLVPHFEKMLYDNALLSTVYLHAWRITDRSLYRRIVEETLDWALVEMRHDLGGFYSSLDADSEGVEGKFYVWQADEIDRIVGEDGRLVAAYYGVTEQGNWEGRNILHVTSTVEDVAKAFGLTADQAKEKIDLGRQKLYAARAQREWPGLDDKILTAWNGLLLKAFAEAGRDLDRSDYLAAAQDIANFVHEHLRIESGRLFRSWKEGYGARFSAYLEDYAFLAEGLLSLYQSTFEDRWYDWAKELIGLIVAHFRDERNGGFYDTADDHEELIFRPKDVQDNAIPSGGASATNALLAISLLSGETGLWDLASEAIEANSEFLNRYPTGFAHWLIAAELLLGQPLEVAIAGDKDSVETKRLLDVVYQSYRPNVVVAVGDSDSKIPLLSGRTPIDGLSAAYVCRRFVCKQPVIDPDDLGGLLS